MYTNKIHALTVSTDALSVRKRMFVTTRSRSVMFISFYNTDSDLELADVAVVVAVVIKSKQEADSFKISANMP